MKVIYFDHKFQKDFVHYTTRKNLYSDIQYLHETGARNIRVKRLFYTEKII